MQITELNTQDVRQFILNNFDGVYETAAWSETTFFYNPEHLFARGTYFATIKEKDGDNDKASNLDRSGIWRLNIGIPKQLFLQHFGNPPKRPAKGQAIVGPWDFTEINQITPHPVYGWMSWISVLNPTAETFEICKPFLREAHKKAQAAFTKRKKAMATR